MHRRYGKYRGIVTQPLDTDMGGKLAALVTVGGSAMPVVAEACTPFAGATGGFFAMPPVGAGVWIEFEEGDVNKPVWTGCWWPQGQLDTALGTGSTSLDTLPVMLQSILGNRLVLGSAPDDCVILETALGEAGPRIVMTSVGIKLSVGETAAVELGPDGVMINGNALTVKPPVLG